MKEDKFYLLALASVLLITPGLALASVVDSAPAPGFLSLIAIAVIIAIAITRLRH